MKHTDLRHCSLLALVLMAVVTAGCASAPEVGVRPAFEQRKVPRVAVVPFYSVGNFSLPADKLSEVLRASEQAAVASLRDEGFDVVGPRTFRQHLAENGSSNTFDEGVLLRSELADYFEPAQTEGGASLEVTTIQELYEQGKLPAEALLFGEVVYHTRTECRVDPTPYNEHAAVSRLTQNSGESPSPCIVTHFQAKLVHAPTGETMWFNRRLLQTHTAEASTQAAQQNLSATIASTLGGPDGLAAFRGETHTAALNKEEKAKN